jgi:hypothetical protein
MGAAPGILRGGMNKRLAILFVLGVLPSARLCAADPAE